ncbi:MAG: hypothetical protein QHH25_03775 [Candidatus Acetothermia bacterium]|nr:hypothetical protein [Candidatus Acetothermia bacterium]
MRAFTGILLALLAVSSAAGVGLAQTVTIGQGQSPLGAATELAVILNSAPRGLAEFELTVRLGTGVVGEVEALSFPETFREDARVELAPDRDSVKIKSVDRLHQVEAGASGITLAVLRLRGTLTGQSSLEVLVGEMRDDLGNPFDVATQAGELRVYSNLTPGLPAVVGGSDSVYAGAVVEVPVILTEAPEGLSSYRVRVSLAEGDLADILGVVFIAFAGQAQAQVAVDKNSIDFSASDDENIVKQGDAGIVLGRVQFKGVLLGESALKVEVVSMFDDQGRLMHPLLVNGELTVGQVSDLAPPEFFELQPFGPVGIAQPAVSARVLDPGSGVNPETLLLRLWDAQGLREFRKGDRGVGWDGEKFSVNLSQLGLSLARGEVFVQLWAADNSGHLGMAAWTFTVTVGGPPPPGGLSIEQAIAALVPGDPPGAANPDLVIGDQEILRAISFWINGEAVPNTGGQTIDDSKMLELIALWIGGTPVSGSAAAAAGLAPSTAALTVEKVAFTGSRFIVQGRGIESIAVRVWDLSGRPVFAGQAAGNALLRRGNGVRYCIARQVDASPGVR